MSLTTSAPGKHTAAYRELQDRLADTEARLDQAEADNRALTAANEDLVCHLARTIIDASRHSMRAAVADEENGRLKTRVKELGNKVIRAAANEARLRQAVINARPRIREVPTDLVRPYSPVVCLPYVSPVPYRSTANDETQQLPAIELPSTTQ